MTSYGEDVMVESPTQTDSEKGTKKRRRIPRACDRCRLKKSKCDGLNPCQSCKVTDSVCLFRTRRNRDAKGYYWYMRDITDEALIRLYWACRERTGFPGHPINETEGRITAHAILEGLGLTGPLQDDSANNLPRNCPTRPAYPSQASQQESPTPPLTPDDSITSGITSGADSRMNSTSTIDPREVSEGTRLQRQLQQQFELPPTFRAPQPDIIIPQPYMEIPGMDVSPYNYIHTQSRSREMCKASLQADVNGFDAPLLPQVPPHPHPEAYPADGLMSSEFFDFQTVSATPGLGLDNFDFTYSHDFTPMQTPDLAAFPA